MQLLIVLLLVLIVLILAPWLIWVLLAGAVAYGAIMAVAGAVLVAALAFVFFRSSINDWLSKKRVSASIEEANRIYRVKERLESRINLKASRKRALGQAMIGLKTR